MPVGQAIQGKIVDDFDKGIVGTVVQVRYHQPDNPIRRVLIDQGSITDTDGKYVLHNFGTNVEFYIDVVAPNYPPMHSELLKLETGETEVEDMALRELEGTIIVRVVDKSDQPLARVPVALLADPSGFFQSARRSWIFLGGFRKRTATSVSGNARFSGVLQDRSPFKRRPPTIAWRA